MLAAAEPVDALDVEHVRADALDLRSERDEKAAEILDVRLARGVADHGLALGERCRHDRVLGSHDRGLVQVDALAAKTGRLHLVRAVQLDLDAELLKGVDVRIEPAAPDHVAAGGRHRHPPEAGQERAGEQERRTDLPAEIGVEIGLDDPARIDPDLVRPGPLGVCADVDEKLDHRPDVADARHVREAHLFRGEQARREDRKRGVLVACRADGAAERPTAFDHEGLHGAGMVLGGPGPRFRGQEG